MACVLYPPTLAKKDNVFLLVIHRFEAIRYYVATMAEAIEARYPELAEMRANPPEPKPKKHKKKVGGADGRGRGGRGRGAGSFFVHVLPGLPDPNTGGGDDENADDAGGEGEDAEKRGRLPVTWVNLVDKLVASTLIFKRLVSSHLPT
jgi:hypothetical protein